jgi:hypothetical protein
MFTNDSRWDRHTPDQNRDEKPIEVGAIFEKGKIKPSFFIHNGIRHPVKEITYYWQEKRGAETLHFFSLTDGANLYKIYFNNQKLHWRLVESCPD